MLKIFFYKKIHETINYVKGTTLLYTCEVINNIYEALNEWGGGGDE